MSKIKKNLDDEKSADQLLIGTESRHLIIMEPSGVKEKKRFDLPAPPCQIVAIGTFDVDHKIFVSCRDGKVYLIKQGHLQDHSYDIESKPVAMVYHQKSIVIAGMNSMIHSFYAKGKKNYSCYLPSPIACMEKIGMT